MIYILGYDFDDKKVLSSKLKDRIQQRPFKYWETRTCSEPEFNKRFAKEEGPWLSVGTEHTVLPNGWIRRNKAIVQLWSMDINVYEDFNDLIKEFGPIHISFWDKYQHIPYISLED